MDLSELLNEMGDMELDLTMKKTVPPLPNKTKTDVNSTSVGVPITVGRDGAIPMMRSNVKQQPKQNKRKHDTHGACPVELMTEFLVLVSSGKMKEALEQCNQILKHEPDNPLIKMYQDTMKEYVQQGLQEEDEEDDDDEDYEDSDENDNEDEVGDDSGSDSLNEDEDEDEEGNATEEIKGFERK